MSFGSKIVYSSGEIRNGISYGQLARMNADGTDQQTFGPDDLSDQLRLEDRRSSGTGQCFPRMVPKLPLCVREMCG